ncbi:MAG TPA: hypothetical protein VN896_04945, partial [Methylomirabilota bacterium]|nr:hypothetical protein [Methylomirabilota bacterium]
YKFAWSIRQRDGISRSFLVRRSARTKIETEAEEVEYEHRRAIRLGEVHPLDPRPKPPAPEAPSATVTAGTGVKITVGTALTSETATVGQEWIGQVAEAVTVGPMAPFPAGAVVHGVVSAVKPAVKGDRALLILRVTSIEANGKTHQISATADSLIAGSTRTRNVGAVAGAAGAGALIGSAVGGGKGALIGGLIGGAAATGAAANSKGFQVTVKEGAEMVFKVDHDTKLKL